MPLVRSQVVWDGPPSQSGEDPSIEYQGSTWTTSAERYLAGHGLTHNQTALWLTTTVPGTVPLPGAGRGPCASSRRSPCARRRWDPAGDSLVGRDFHDEPGRHDFRVWYRDVDGAGLPSARVSDAVVVDLNG